MKRITAKQLKQHTGAILKMIRAGEMVTLTYRGKPIAVIRPVEKDSSEIDTKHFEEIWDDIESSIASSTPAFSTWEEATGWVRTRT